jgi:hypothetical protein
MPAVDADIDATSRQLQRLAETGARLAIEVRGRANDFLRTVEPFPFAEIKTGGAAILRFARTVRGPGLSAISELLELAQKHNAAITAVGVEDQASLSALRGLGFAAAQGNHLGRVGDLKLFMPSHVNEVRALLGLDPLSSDDLAALFRTGGPKLAAAAAPAMLEDQRTEGSSAAPVLRDLEPQIPDDIVERLAARIAQSEAKARPAPARARAPADPEEKAAAIARAKRKNAIREKLASRNALKEKAEEREDHVAPAREMQERLSREFEAFSESAAPGGWSASESAPAVDPIAADHDYSGELADETPAPLEEADMTAHGGAARSLEPHVHGEAHMTVDGATARFTPTLRVGGPEPRAPHEFGHLHALEANEVDEIEPLEHRVAPPASRNAATQASEAAENEIPAVASNAQWVEDTVAVEAADIEETPPTRRKKRSFLTRTVIPYSALRITHFWPRFLRNRMKGQIEEAADEAA